MEIVQQHFQSSLAFLTQAKASWPHAPLHLQPPALGHPLSMEGHHHECTSFSPRQCSLTLLCLKFPSQLGQTASSFPKGRLPSWRHGGCSTLWAAFWTPYVWSRAPDITLVSSIPSQLLKLRMGQNKGLQRPQMMLVPGGKAALPYFPPCQVGHVIKPGTMSSAQIEFFGSVLRKENTSFRVQSNTCLSL